MQDLRQPDPYLSRQLRLNTLIRLRWLAVVGQTAAVLGVAYWLEFPMPVSLCFALIACSAWLNLLLALRYPSTHRLDANAALGILLFDTVQLAGLLFMTGGMTNPFAVLMTVPVVVSATSLPLRLTLFLGVAAVASATVLVFFHLPLPWFPNTELPIPFIYVAGLWLAVTLTIVFTAVYAWRVAEEARQLANALTATELVLQREQHLSALDGLAAAAAHELGTPLATIALVAKEMERAIGSDSKFYDDVMLLRTQSERCREILKRLTSLSSASEEYLARMPLSSLIEEVVAPHRDFGIEILLEQVEKIGPEPVSRRNPGVMYGLGNLVENAVDFAREQVVIRWGWNASGVTLQLVDDGPGFKAEILDRVGEPYMTTRSGGQVGGQPSERHGGGLGLGVFIAKTLLERSGATVTFSNSPGQGLGAVVDVKWPREAFVALPDRNAEPQFT